jgi:hypothetical protein
LKTLSQARSQKVRKNKRRSQDSQSPVSRGRMK